MKAKTATEYKALTEETFRQTVEKFGLSQDNAKREFVLQTGIGGAQRFQHIMEAQNATDALKLLFDEKAVTQDDYDSLLKLIQAEDMEALPVAVSIIEQRMAEHYNYKKQKNHGSKI